MSTQAEVVHDLDHVPRRPDRVDGVAPRVRAPHPPEGNLLPEGVGVLDQGSRSVEIRGRPHTAVRLEGVGTERFVALEVRREDLARHVQARRAAEQIHHVGAVDREVHRLPHPLVVERWPANVHADVVGDRERREYDLIRMGRLQRCQVLRLRRVGHPVELAGAQPIEGARGLLLEPPRDRVHESVGLRGSRPLVERRVPHQLEAVGAGFRDHVRPRRRDGVQALVLRPGSRPGPGRPAAARA